MPPSRASRARAGSCAWCGNGAAIRCRRRRICATAFSVPSGRTCQPATRASREEAREPAAACGQFVDEGSCMTPDRGGSHGRLQVVTTYLEMRAPHPRRDAPLPLRKIALLRAQKMPVHFYRYPYEHVGEEWLWYERRALDDEALRAIIHDERVDISVLYADGSPAGYSELD